ncbi:MAG: hypothetical protein AUK44_08115 [Porphyromonadaceae bacterium CG2_30_38_12]|nr:MAG: hypothetical protein AUK44_08115 [Porphyromonadaceae bacterium CG2_30_38_12]
MENNKQLKLSNTNFILIAVGFLIIVTGFLLMTGSATIIDFNPDVFSFRRITVAPMVSLAGFLFVIFAILYQPKSSKK